MALSTILKEECPKCGKLAVEVSRLVIGESKLITLQCGHIIGEDAVLSGTSKANADAAYNALVSIDGKRPMKYQIEGIKFLERANGNAILADEQGLGKTIQAACLVKLHVNELLPAVAVVPATVTRQWLYELFRWIGKRPYQIINKGSDVALPGMDVYIITYDLLKKEEIFALVPQIKLLILDECQRIKNHLSERAKAVQKFIVNKFIEHVLPMSGTPIKNNAGEYYTVLNLVDRRKFPHWQKYVNDYCDSYDSGWGTKVGGIRDIVRFKEDTKDIILRRTKAEVLKDLPELTRKFYHVDLDRRLNKAYAKALDELDDLFYSDMSQFEKNTNMIAIMSRLRHITGQSKVDEVVEFVTEFLESTDRKITIFVHHKDVADRIVLLLEKWTSENTNGNNRPYLPPLSLHSGLSSDGRADLIKRFKDENYRILVASTLAAGEGINLQFCSDAVLLERQWNPANEEQAEARFHRFGQENKVSVTYMIASGTIDEYFTELVETKRAIVMAALDGKEVEWDQQSLMKELAQVLVTTGREKWKL